MDGDGFMNSLKILVVDDEARMRKLVKDFLIKKNYEVIEACDGEEAIELFVENKDISLIILDVMMPRMDGRETIKEIRKFSNVPVIMLTAKAEEEDELKVLEKLNPDLLQGYFFSKPCDKETFEKFYFER